MVHLQIVTQKIAKSIKTNVWAKSPHYSTFITPTS
jgi:hypothetical protein